MTEQVGAFRGLVRAIGTGCGRLLRGAIRAAGLPSPVAAITQFTPLTDRGRELLDHLEERTQVTPSEVDEVSGAWTYYLASERAEVDAFDVMLDEIDPDWHEHLTRTGP